jgi:glycosyltransferase involved in cell wall biosynthesis
MRSSQAVICSSVLPELANDPLITIAIPTFNRAPLLKECLGTALAQSYQNFEVVVSDNASTDATAEVLKSVSDQRLRVVRQQRNLGQLANWNACLAEAKGDYAVVLSDDDWIAPWLLERCVALIRRDPRIPVVVTVSDRYVAAERRTLPEVTSRKLGTGIWEGIQIFQELLKGRISPVMCTVMIKTEILRVNGGFKIDWPFASDLASWVPLLLTGKAGLVNERCGTYYIHAATQTSRMALSIHLQDLRKLADLLANTADHSVKDLQRRREIKRQTRRYLANHAIGVIDRHRRRGARLAEVLPVVWQWRRDLIYVGMGCIVSSAVPLILLLFIPRPIIHWLGKSRRKIRRIVSRTSAYGKIHG